jgi:hypothetical protein
VSALPRVSSTPKLTCLSLLIHYKQRDTKIGSSEGQSYLLRHDRALEVGFAAALYLLWPCEFRSTDWISGARSFGLLWTLNPELTH